MVNRMLTCVLSTCVRARLDEIIVFRQLTKGEVKEIADIMLREVFKRAEIKGITIDVTERFKVQKRPRFAPCTSMTSCVLEALAPGEHSLVLGRTIPACAQCDRLHPNDSLLGSLSGPILESCRACKAIEGICPGGAGWNWACVITSCMMRGRLC